MSEDGYILLIEDSPGDAALTRALLDSPGTLAVAPLRWVQSVQAAMALLDAPAPCRVILLDLGLPDSQGLQGLAALVRHGQRCPIIVLTGDESEAVGLAALAAGAQDFLVKGSFDAGLLQRCIRFAALRKRVELAALQRHADAQAALANSAQRLQEGMARVDDGFVAFDRARRFSYVNARALQLLGRQTEAELLGRTIWDEFPQTVDTPFHQAFEQAMATQQPVRRVVYYPVTRRWLAGRLYPSADGLSIYFTDITERKEVELALRESEAYRRSLFEQMADAVLLTGPAGEILDANEQAGLMLGYSSEELLHLGIAAVLIKPEPPAPVDAAVLPDFSPARWSEAELQRQDGSRFPAEIGQRALVGGRLLSVVRDISARRASEAAMLLFQFELSDLAQRLLMQEQLTTQRVAQGLHDHLGQTLAIARLNLEACMATQGDSMPPVLKQQGERIAALLDQAVREVRQVLADLRPPLLEEQGLPAAIDNEIQSDPVAGSAVDVLLEVDDDVATTRWPRDVEYAAFMLAREAITNARRHAGASLIRVQLSGDGRRLGLDVIDDGRGMPPEFDRGRPGHLGMVGMRERAIAIGARFSVTNDIGGGVRVSLHWEAAP